jgi:ElaB/YqjD/DUF883 family membrane-anchored ribosome-binding protein
MNAETMDTVIGVISAIGLILGLLLVVMGVI